MTDNEREEIQRIVPGAEELTEAGLRYIKLPQLRLPEGTVPAVLDCLLCLAARDGYPTRLYFAEPVNRGGRSFNWNGAAHIFGRNWHSFSWNNVSAAQRPLQVLLGHLDALR